MIAVMNAVLSLEVEAREDFEEELFFAELDATEATYRARLEREKARREIALRELSEFL